MAAKQTYFVVENRFEFTKTTVKAYTHVVLAEDAEGKTIALRWSLSKENADRAVKELSGSGWSGHWTNVRAKPCMHLSRRNVGLQTLPKGK